MSIVKNSGCSCQMREVSSFLGKLVILANRDGVYRLLWRHSEKQLIKCRCENILPSYNDLAAEKILAQAAAQLDEYFQGKRTAFDLPLSLQGTDFQQRAWRVLQQIPYGQTISYLQQAKRLKNPNSTRAVGQANGANPIPIIIPCHRVVRSDGALGGYAYGPEIKSKLLELESVS